MDIPLTSERRTRASAMPAWLRRWGRRAILALRAALAFGLLGVWIQTGEGSVWTAWQAAAHTPSAAGLTYDAQRATLPEGPLTTLLAAARTACPPARPVLVLSDDPIALQQGNYILYPRHLIPVHSTDPFDAATLAGQAGGCLFFYGPQGGRLDPVRARLTELACSPAGCLYRVASSE